MSSFNPLPLFPVVLVFLLTSTRMASGEGGGSVPPMYMAMASLASPDLSLRNFVDGLVEALLGYGGYGEITDLLVNLTSTADEIGRLALEAAGRGGGGGYGLTLLAPNDEALAALTAEQLADPNLPERLLHYHLIAEYLTEESMYVSARRLGKVEYSTLQVPLTVKAVEADGTVKVVGGGGSSGHVVDADIYADGRVSVQGIDGVLFPPVAYRSS
ncbi:hypothetical protein SAY87_006121 [Trapa incisa]|uniref:FAS1 domain-containing protein n=1 Tax=Trapa incisa TaxID=236973 RepID=A0AAN7KB20_9MYRT|nr:hypothetical protein SAY87_006121 [Trapa incisa]